MKTKFFPNWLRLMTVLTALAVLLTALAPAGSARAATCTVTSGLDDGNGGTLRDKIADEACDTINFDGDYTITLASQLTIGRNVTIDGVGHNVAISGNNAVRVFWVNVGVTFNLQNLTVANGFAGPDGPDGGGMWVSGANGQVTTVNIAHVTFSDNVNTYVGGMGGGGLSSYNGNLTLTDVTFRDNQAMTGGGMSNTYGIVTLSGVTFSGNSAVGSFNDGYGCGGLISGMSNLTMTNVTFSNNSAEFGGAMCKMMGSATLTNVTFSGNEATYMGGAIYNNSSGFGGPATVLNSILWDNTAPQGAQIYDAGSLPAVVTYSDVQGGREGDGNLDADPKLGALADNGGSTQTMALLPGSAAIDAGDDSACPTTDQRGVVRPQGAHCDMGAYEAIVYQFVGFTSPVDNPPVMNIAKAGQTIPLKWRLLYSDGTPVTNLADVTVTAASLACSAGTSPDQVDEYATGESGLQNLGDGYYQWNWKTPKSYANSCKTLNLDLGEGASNEHTALFQFNK
jgi:predicted outer membrane repeat protein